jgi:hypothetical protein
VRGELLLMADTNGGFAPRYIIVCYDCRRNETRVDTIYTNGGAGGAGGWGVGWNNGDPNLGRQDGFPPNTNAGWGGRGGYGGAYGARGENGQPGGGGNNGGGAGGGSGGEPGPYISGIGRVRFVDNTGDCRGRVE